MATALTEQLIKLIRSRRRTKLNAADVLVIDEVSMMHAWLFDMVDQICRIVRRDSRPFGGLSGMRAPAAIRRGSSPNRSRGASSIR